MQIIHQAPLAALGLGAAFTVVWGVADPAMALAEIKTYIGVGQCAMGDLVTPQQAKTYARELAMINAREQAGVYLASYTRSSQANLTANEITAIAGVITEVKGEVKYEQMPGEVHGLPVVVYTATLEANVDTDGIAAWLRQSDEMKADMARQSAAEKQEVQGSLQKIENLSQAYTRADSQQEKESIRNQFNEEDRHLSAIMKTRDAWLLYLKKEYERALAGFREAIDLDPQYALPWTAMGVVYNSMGDRNKAMECHRKAIDLDPKLDNAYNNIGRIYNAMGDYKRGLEYYQKAIALAPDDAIYQSNIAYTYNKLGNYDKGIEHGQKAIQLDPDFTVAYNNLGSIYDNMGDQDKAIMCYEKAISLDINDAEVYCNMGVAFYKKGDKEKALFYLRQAIAIDYDLAMAHQSLGTVYNDMKEYDRAVMHLKRAIEINPGYKTAYVELILAYSKLGKKQEALQAIDKYLELDPGSEDAKKIRAAIQNKLQHK